MRVKARWTPETVQVFPLDMERLNQDIDKHFHEDGKLPANITYHAHGTLALMRQPKLCIIDDEFIGHALKDKVTFYIYEEEHHPDGGFTGHYLPSYEVSMLITELETYLKPETSLAEFSKERRGHNSRIQANEAEWVKYLNK